MEISSGKARQICGERQAAFVEIAKELAAEDDLERLFALIGERVCRLIGTDSACLSIVEGDELVFRGAYGFDEAWRATQRRTISESRVGRVVLTRRAYATSDMTTDPHWRGSDIVTRFGYRAILEVPVLLRGKVIGVLAAMHKAPRTFSADDVALLTALADHTAVTLDRATLARETQARRREAEVLAELASSINASLDLGTVLQRVAEGAKEVCGSDLARIALRDPGSGALVVRHRVGVRYERYDAVRIEQGKGVGGQVLVTGRPFRTDHYTEDPRFSKDYLEVAREEGVVTELAVPIRIGDRVEGLLYVDNRSPRPFTDRDEAILLRLADHAAIAVQNARLFGETERRRRAAEGLAELGRLLQQSLDPEEVGQRIADSVCALLDVMNSVLFRIEPESGDLVSVAISGDLGPAVGDTLIHAPGSGLAGMAVRERHPVVTPNVLADPRVALTPEVRARFEQAPFRAALSVPLLVKDRVIGALSVGDREGRVFDAEEIRLVEAFADQAALAIENARLFEEARRQHQEAVALEEVAREITSSLDRGEVLQRIVNRARELCGSDLAFLAPYDREADTAPIVAASGARTEALTSVTIRRGLGTGGMVLETGEPFATEDYLHDPRFSKDYADAAIQEGFVAQAVAPLRFGGATTGLLWVVNRTPRRFTARDLGVLTKLADQAAIALENSRLYGELRAALDAVETSQQRIIQTERLRALGEMAGGVAHDFNNVLAAILGRAQLLLRRTEDPEIRRQLQVIEKVALEAAQSVRRIQEFTRTRRLRPFQTVDLSRVVEEAVELTRSRWKDEAQARGVVYDVRVETVPLPPVAGEPSELREALTNLVLNALDAMPEGGRLTVGTGVEGEQAHCVVTDTGIGMPEEVRRRIFDPFFTTKGPKGTGLGLSMVYGIIARHGGEVEVRSRVGQGSAFTIRLPVGRETPEAPEETSPAQPPRRATILVIDDEPEVRELLVEWLASQGHVVSACADGRSGLSRFQEEPVDLVITDLGMPGLTGWEVAKRVKLASPKTPVALVTGWGDQIDSEEARAKGVDFLLAKPFRLEEITAIVARAVSPGARPASNL